MMEDYGLTQEELADRAELSKGFISQLERNLTSPSIATLTDILQCLGTTLGEFFNETPEEQVVFGKADYFEKYDAELKNEIRWIIPNAQKNMMEPILITLEAGGSTYPDNPHEGEEFGYVLQGSISIHIGSKTVLKCLPSNIGKALRQFKNRILVTTTGHADIPKSFAPVKYRTGRG